MTSLTRRSAILGGLLLLGGRGHSRGQNPPVVQLTDFTRDSRSHSAAIRQALEAARKANAKLVAAAGTYVLDDDIIIDWDGVDFEGAGDGTRFVQTVPGRGFLQLRGHNNLVRGFSFACDYERKSGPGAYRGYRAWQRVTAVWMEGGNSLVEAVSAQNSFGVVCLRGPVVERPADSRKRKDTNDYDTYDFVPRASGNRLKDISGRNTDFVMTGNQQEDLEIDGLTARDTTNRSVPPHAIYMQNPGSQTAFCGRSHNVRIRRLSARGNPYSQAFKLSDIRGLTVSDVEVEECAGGVMVSTTDGAKVDNVRLSRLKSDTGRSLAGISVSQSVRVRIKDCTVDSLPGQKCTGVLVFHESSGVDVSAVSVVDQYDARSGVAPFAVGERSEAIFSNCSRRRLGTDSPMFLFSGGARGQIDRPLPQGSGWLVQASADCEVRVSVDPAKANSWDPVRSVRGNGKVTFGAPVERQRPRPLPGGEGDFSCLK